ncbi:GNAT family N-acetyltransferase [Pelagibius sp. 7325]|uniref:GNAT family N-acetyltransferase n=1 Tax=Pelagibius sp. 7325 TaxID=3131994 RepID=UPI0030EB42B9
MTALKSPFRPATPADAAVLAELVNHAGESLPLYLWDKMKEPGETAWDVGLRRAARDEGAFSYRNAVMIEHDGRAAGALIGYGIADEPEPVAADIPPMFRPLQELENLATGTWYVNVLAVLPAFRNLGLGGRLLTVAEEIGRADGKTGMSIIVSDANAGARRLYERLGYRFVAERPMVKEDWLNPGHNWLLLVK